MLKAKDMRNENRYKYPSILEGKDPQIPGRDENAGFDDADCLRGNLERELGFMAVVFDMNMHTLRRHHGPPGLSAEG